MKHSLKSRVLAGLVLAFSWSALAQYQPSDPNHPLKPGDAAPAFALKDQNGREVSLASLTEKGTVAVVFFRSADWCPFCQRNLMELQSGLGSLKQADIQLVAISYDSVESLSRFASRRDIQYPLLSDPGSKTIDAYQVRNTEAKAGKQAGIPYPGVFIIGKDGKIIARLGHDGYRDRVNAADIVKAVEGK